MKSTVLYVGEIKTCVMSMDVKCMYHIGEILESGDEETTCLITRGDIG